MSPVLKYIIFQALIMGPFIAGYVLKRRFASPVESSRKIVRANLIGIEPLIALWSIWGLRLNAEAAVLPFAGLSLVLAGLALGRIAAPLLGLKGQSRATFIISSSLANHGFTMGGFVCYLLLGETGLGLSFIFLAYFMLYTYLVIFPYARRASAVGGERPALASYFLDFQNLPLAGVLAGLALNLGGVLRPDIPFPMDILLALSVASYYFSLGINFSVSDITGTLRESAALSMIKFIILPVLAMISLSAFDLQSGIRTVIIVQSFMPGAIFSVLAAILFRLDTRIASGFFVVSTVLFTVVVLPLLLWLLPALL